MKIIICDRCGKTIEGSDYEDKYPTIIMKYKLCMECFTDFEKFMGEKDNG